MSDSRSTLIVGASSQIGDFLIPRLLRDGAQVVAISRRARPGTSGRLRWLELDINQPQSFPTGNELAAQTLIHLGPLRLLPALLPVFLAQGGRRVIAFGTTSRISKAGSSNPKEQAFAANLLAAEQAVAKMCEAAQVPWTLFRPTLIYGAGRDRNVALMARLVRRFHLFPLLGNAKGLRQPVHADDLAAACVAVIDNQATFNKAYELSGGETLAYRDMVCRIFESLGVRPRFIRIPVTAFALAMRLLSIVPRYRDFNVEMARRMNEDLVFDHSDARLDFDYAPRRFDPASGLPT